MIRKATVNDIDSLLQLTNACAIHMINQGIYQWNENYPSREAFEIDLKRGELFVFEEESVAIGCVVISSVKDDVYQPIKWLSNDENNIYIHRLAVHPNHQGKGYAQQFMDFAETFAKTNHYESVRLDTFSQNKRNQKFYEQRGYKRLGNIYFPKQSEYPFYCYELVF